MEELLFLKSKEKESQAWNQSEALNYQQPYYYATSKPRFHTVLLHLYSTLLFNNRVIFVQRALNTDVFLTSLKSRPSIISKKGLNEITVNFCKTQGKS